jgi:2-C-methyl-D-erythritol 4-phosphate cytidylyltransferase/2-C-methyl-D-erythritol 2,4-cyclodiphosphate synthase
VAAGRGVRAGGAAPKQFVNLGGQTMLRRSVVACEAHPAVAQLVVVLPADCVADGAALIGPTRTSAAVVAGGDRRQDSVRAGFSAVSDAADIVLIHDAARPFAPVSIFDRVISAALIGGAVVPAVRVPDTVKRVARGQGPDPIRRVAETIPREEVWLAQTPQGFRREVLASAIAAGQLLAEATGEAQVVERVGREVQVVDGDPRNTKVTTEEDVREAQRATSVQTRVGTGYDLHRLVAGRPLVFAGVVVPHEFGPLGHSDGDVVCHALTDAMLGAAGAGDIGQLFPNSDPRWKDAPGLDLLVRALSVVHARGWRVANVDVTVVLEQPRLSPHVPAIRAALAAALGIAVDDVSVKGKTNEGVDAVGRGEAIASHAVALLARGPS